MDKKKLFVFAVIILLSVSIIFCIFLIISHTKEGLEQVDNFSKVIEQFWARVSGGITRRDWDIIRTDRYNDEVVFIHVRIFRTTDAIFAYLPRKDILYLEDYSATVPDIDFNRAMYVELRPEKKRGGGGGE